MTDELPIYAVSTYLHLPRPASCSRAVTKQSHPSFLATLLVPRYNRKKGVQPLGFRPEYTMDRKRQSVKIPLAHDQV
ncbi:predicted protein [Botrytis cinerea T4]|uniref:Uncharacterized protein n=1 Tax=Botryotinia fuckeliana (strain T4) TaxID=999810 RepID=G2Y1E2_BOTF4|nr:predicted protein [Botrytis cinerea T4]